MTLDIQTYLTNAMKARRQEVLSRSDQLTLGELILKFEAFVEKHKSDKDEPTVAYDFEYLFPTGIGSWRGSYDELALNFTDKGEPPTASKFLKLLKGTVGQGKPMSTFKDQDGLYKPIVPILFMIGGILYFLFCIFVAFPFLDKVVQ